jgi:hypothetical protein
MGRVSDNAETLDCDEIGLCDELELFARDHGFEWICDLPRIRTLSGCDHLRYRVESGTPVKPGQTLAAKIGDDGKRKKRIETRGEGNYAVAPPSPGYTIIRGDPANPPVLTAEQYATLHQFVHLMFDQIPNTEKPQEPVSVHQEFAGSGLSPWADYNLRGDYENVLARHGWTACGQSGGKRLWKRPGKIGRGWSATTGYAVGRCPF